MFKNTHPLKFSHTLPATLIMVFIFFSACIKKEDFDFDKLVFPYWEPNFSLPLVHSKLDLRKVLNETNSGDLIIEDANKFLTLIYKNRLFSQKAEDIFWIDNQYFNHNQNFNISGNFVIGDSAISTYNESIVFVNSNNEILDTLYLKDGTLNFQLNTNLNHGAKIRVTMPNVRKNGIPFSETMYYVSGSNINANFDMGGYRMVFHHTGGTNNQIDVYYEVTAYNTNNAANLSPYNLNFGLNFENLKYAKMFGFLNQKNYLFPIDTLGIGIFKNSWIGNFILEDPKLKIIISSSYGFPLHIIFNYLEAINPKTSNAVLLNGIPAPIAVAKPLNIGDVETTTFTLHKNNSNVLDAFNILPHYYAYHFEGLANPSGAYTPNFAIDTSYFHVDVEAEMPLYGRAWDFVLEDTVDFQFDKIDEVQHALFKIMIENGFPVDAKIQIYFADSLDIILDSLFNGQQEVILAALVGAGPDYRVTSSQTKYTEVNLTATRLTNISNARKLYIRSTLATTNNGGNVVKIYSDYLVDVRLSVQAQLKVNPNE